MDFEGDDDSRAEKDGPQRSELSLDIKPTNYDNLEKHHDGSVVNSEMTDVPKEAPPPQQ